MKKSILIAEDDESLLQVITESLTRKGFTVVTARNGLEALLCFRERNFDLLILDVMMPRVSGWDVAEEFRKTDRETPILFLTAKSGKEDLVKGYELGGNDYLRKPFHLEELFLRVRELLSRSPAADTLFKIGKYTFDPVRQELLYEGVAEKLSHRETGLLRKLCEHKGQVLDRKKVLLELWGDDDFFSARNMDTYISRLRKKLSRDAGIQIINLRGYGYKLIT